MQAEEEYKKYTVKGRLDKAINTLLGLVEGITMDGLINSKEIGLFNLWLSEHQEVKDKHPYNEIIPVVEQAISDGVIDDDERRDILWLCEKFKSTKYYDEITADLQILHGILGGVAADREVKKAELEGLSLWLEEHEHLRRCYPFDEVDSLIIAVLKDGHIDEVEHEMLINFFSEFLSVLDDKTITSPIMNKESTISGVCAVCPEITFTDSTFCFTGKSNQYTKDSISSVISSLGGRTAKDVSKKVDYLVIGSEGNPSWVYSCYGRKVESAVTFRKNGHKMLIIHENDFHDAVLDAN